MEQSVEPVASSPATTNQKNVDLLGDRMKGYELATSTKLNPSMPFIIRLDGHGFSSFTRPFKKPFDERIHNAMVATATDLMLNFNGTTAYTASDEITLIFPAIAAATTTSSDSDSDTQPGNSNETSTTNERTSSSEDLAAADGEANKGNANNNTNTNTNTNKQEQQPKTILPYGGKVQKLVSLSAGFASTCFNRHLAKEKFDSKTEQKLIDHIENTRPHFDARVFQVPENHELVNNVIWRSHFDWRRNSVASLAKCHFSTKQLHKLNTAQMKEKLLAEKGIDWNTYPEFYKFGTFVKKEKYEMHTQLKNGTSVTATRTRTVTKSFDMDKYTEENEKFLTSKHINVA